jgi:hypothetical protein
MTYDELLALWGTDSVINPANIIAASVDIAKLKHKYMLLLGPARMALHEEKQSYKILYKEKYEFYDQGPSKEKMKDEKYAAWARKSMPAKGKSSSKKELDMYIDADPDIIKHNQRIMEKELMVDTIQEIMKTLDQRGWIISTIQKERNWKEGN